MTIKALIFDLDDTLLWDERSVAEAFDATCTDASKLYPINPGDLEQSVRKEARTLYQSFESFPFTQMIGINPFEALWAEFSEGEHVQFKFLRHIAPYYRKESWTRGLKGLGIDDEGLGSALADLFPKERRSRPFVYDDTFSVLDKLKGNYKLLLLTNGAPDLQKEKVAGVPSLASYFDHIVISGNFGVGKPDISIFQYAMELLQTDKGEILMVGDKLATDILGSRRAKISNVWVNRNSIERNDEIVPDFTVKDLEQLMGILH